MPCQKYDHPCLKKMPSAEPELALLAMPRRRLLDSRKRPPSGDLLEEIDCGTEGPSVRLSGASCPVGPSPVFRGLGRSASGHQLREGKVTVTIDKARGCLLGQAVGDALGAPIEGWSRGRIRRIYGEVRDYIEAAGRARLPGLYTDDTQQALILADVLIEYRGFDPEGARRLYVELARPSPGLPRGAYRGTGGSFRAALERMAAASPGESTGVASAGNGAAMRIAPLGLWYAGDHAALQQAVIQASRQTHTDPRAIAAASAVAYLAAHLATMPAQTADDARAALRAAAAFAQETEAALCSPGHEPRPPRFSSALLILEPLWEAPPWDVLHAIVVEANRQ